MNRFYLDDKDYLAGLLGLFFALLTMVMLLFCLSKYIHISVDAVELKQIYKTNFALNPEPQERLLFLIGCVFMPIALWLFYNLFAKVLAGVRGKRLISNYTRFLYLAVIAVLYCYTFFLVRKGGYLGGYFLLQGALGLTPLNLFSICLAGVVILLALIYEKKNYKVSIICKITNLSVIVFALLAIISVVVFCVFGRSSVSIRGVADYHFNSVFNPVGQDYFGKSLLTNSVSLYGL